MGVSIRISSAFFASSSICAFAVFFATTLVLTNLQTSYPVRPKATTPVPISQGSNSFCPAEYPFSKLFFLTVFKSAFCASLNALTLPYCVAIS